MRRDQMSDHVYIQAQVVFDRLHGELCHACASVVTCSIICAFVQAQVEHSGLWSDHRKDRRHIAMLIPICSFVWAWKSYALHLDFS